MEQSHFSKPVLFVSNATYLKKSPGGVQICTQEYIKTLQAANFDLSIVSYQTDTRILSRLRRKLLPKPYAYRLPATLVDEIISQASKNNVDFIFLNQVDIAPIARYIRERLGQKCKIILLSHGLESTDIFHAIRTKNDGDAFQNIRQHDLTTLALSLVEECRHRQYIDYVFCLSAFETEIERWLGAKNVTWLPRTISQNPLPWNPHSSRLGFVGTINHTPNKEGLILFLKALEKIAPNDVRLRIVGGPESAAKAIQKRFPLVEYLGRLSNEELEKEASTWSCFVHPLFCYSRGCSTKLAIALGWEIPVVTTPAGCRGYSWLEGELPLAQTPESLAQLALEMLDNKARVMTQKQISTIVSSVPTIDDIANKVKSNLSLLD